MIWYKNKCISSENQSKADEAILTGVVLKIVINIDPSTVTLQAGLMRFQPLTSFIKHTTKAEGTNDVSTKTINNNKSNQHQGRRVTVSD